MLNERKRVTLRIKDDLYENLKYWANKNDMNINDYLIECIQTRIDFENGNYHVPDLMITRLTQLVDGYASLVDNFNQLEDVCNAGFKSIVDLTRGANYLMDDGDDIK